MGWTQPNDQIAAIGLQFKYHLDDNVNVSMPLYEGSWKNDEAKTVMEEVTANGETPIQLLQKGPDRRKTTSLRSLYLNNFNKKGGNDESEKDLEFKATVSKGEANVAQAQKAKGWVNVTDGKRGVGLGIKNFMKEHPKGIEVDPANNTLLGSIWPKENGPMNFARHNTEPDGGMLDNFAQGITKTTEFVYYFHDDDATESVGKKWNMLLKVPSHTPLPSGIPTQKFMGTWHRPP